MTGTRQTKLDALLDAAVDAIVIADGFGRIDMVNAATCQMFGYSEAELLGENVRMLMPGYWANQHDGFLAAYRATGVKRIIGIGREVQGRRKGGTEFRMHLSVGEYRIGDEMSFVGIVRDLTRREAVEEALRRSQRMEALGRMTGGIAHDFNNLLTVITGNIELLEGALLSAEDKAAAGDALAAAASGAQLVEQLLQFARRGQLKPEVFDPASLVLALRRMLDKTLGPGTELIVDCPEETWRLRTDPVQLQTALLNLAANSRDAMGQGGRFSVELRNATIDPEYGAREIEMAAGDYIQIAVSDTGAGMSADTVRHALEPFFTTKGKGRGSGLGLSMVYGFVKQSGGHIVIYSEVGLGTTINLFLPRHEGELDADTGTPSGVERARERLQNRLILVVEDDPRVRAITATRLKNLRCRVVEARNAAEAAAILQQNAAFDLVFSDLAMPGEMSGLDLCEMVTQTYPGIAVLLSSGYAEDVMRGDRLQAMRIPLLRKPYRERELVSALASALQIGNTSGVKM